MNAVLKFFIGLLAVAAIGVAATTMKTAPGSSRSVSVALQEKAEQALTVDDRVRASVIMDGQKAIITGAAPDDAARQALIDRVAASSGPGGLVTGGVTAVDATRLIVSAPAPRAEPFIFIAEREGGVLSLSGNVPDQETRDSIYRLAPGLFPETEISGVLEIADGAPVSAQNWFNAAASSLRALSHLRKGVAEANDQNFSITGEAEDETRAAAARTLLTDLPEGLNGTADIVIRKPPASIEDIISLAEEETLSDETLTPGAAEAPTETAPGQPETVGAEIEVEQAAPPEDDCATRLQSTITARRIGFTSARADIDNPSRDQLRNIAILFSECPASVRLAITGHTDSSGNAARNRQLSGYRADAVRAFLVSVGAPADRITARGAGSSEPIASNRTPEGRERNRRIEIEVITQE